MPPYQSLLKYETGVSKNFLNEKPEEGVSLNTCDKSQNLRMGEARRKLIGEDKHKCRTGLYI